MSTAKHTPGPGEWFVAPQGRDGSRYLMERTALGAIRVAKFCGSTALSSFPGAEQPEGMEERMTLAAAAPDLLAELEDVLSAIQDDGEIDADSVRAAIAKVRGGA